MQTIKMLFLGKVETFSVTYTCPQYIFCECQSNPSARGFFTTEYVNKNKQA